MPITTISYALIVRGGETASADTFVENQTIATDSMGTIIHARKADQTTINLTLESAKNAEDPYYQSSHQPDADSFSELNDLNDYMVLISMMYYTDAFKNRYYTDPNQSIYHYAMDYDSFSESERSGMNIVFGGQEQADALIKTIANNPEFFDNILLLDVDHQEYVGSPTAPIINDGYAYKLTFKYFDDILIYYPGTAGDVEFYTNAQGSFDSDTSSQENALLYFDQQYEKYGSDKNYYLMGVSNGGNKAMYSGLLRGDKITHVYSLGGQGFGNGFLNKYASNVDKYKNKISVIVSDEDFVHIMLKQVGEITYYKSQVIWGPTLELAGFTRVMGMHAPFGILKIQPDGTLALAQKSTQNGALKFFHEFFEYAYDTMPQSDFLYMADQLMALFLIDQDLYMDRKFNFMSSVTNLTNLNVINTRLNYSIPELYKLINSFINYSNQTLPKYTWPDILHLISGFVRMAIPNPNTNDFA